MPNDALNREDAVDLLKEGGWPVNLDKDGDLEFRNQGFNHYLLVRDSGEHYWAMVVPDLFEATSIFDRDIAVDEVNRLCREYKLGKAFLGPNGRACVEYEFLASDRDSLSRSILRGCDLFFR